MNVPDKLISQCSWEEICIFIFVKKSKGFPSVRDLSSEFGIPKSNIQRKLKKLQDLGYIECRFGTPSGTPSGTPNNLNTNSFDMTHGTPSGTPSGTPKTNGIDERKKAFEYSLAPFVTRGQYDAKMVRAFSDYWTEYNKSRTKMRWELEKTWETPKRLSTWANKDKQIDRSSYLSQKKKEQDEVGNILKKYL